MGSSGYNLGYSYSAPPQATAPPNTYTSNPVAAPTMPTSYGQPLAPIIPAHAGGSAQNAAQVQSGQAFNTANMVQSGANDIYNLTQPELQSFVTYLNSLTSPNSATRMAAVAPAITDITNQTQGAIQQIKNLPRGGEQDYLEAQAAQTGATNVSNLLSSAYTQAEQEMGKLGQQGFQDWLQASGEAGNLELGAATSSLSLADLKAQANQASMSEIASIAGDVGQGLAMAAAFA